MKYIYKHSATRFTTGYFECVPETDMSLPQALRILASRPRDIFLWRHVLGKLLESSPQEAVACCGDFLQVQELQDFFQTAARLSPELGESIAPRGAFLQKKLVWAGWPDSDIVSTDKDAELRKIFYENIHNHMPLPHEVTANRQHLKKAGSKENLLAAVYEQLKGSSFESQDAPPLKEIYAKAGRILAERNLEAGPEMRHEASLSPIALLRNWNLRAGVNVGSTRHELIGIATAYGRGLSLAKARVSCCMEIIERASAYALVEAGGKYGRIGDQELILASWRELQERNMPALRPALYCHDLSSDAEKLFWLQAIDAQDNTIFVPAQAVYLFCNLDEPVFFENLGSTGLAAGTDDAGAKVAALLEVIERDAHAVTPFCRDNCFELTARNEIVKSLLDDYRWRGIRVQFQDITSELGLPAYRCFVKGQDGLVAQATGAGLSGAKAALAALTETPWPYVWANPVPAPSGPALPDLPIRVLEDLPNYDLGSSAANLALLEATFRIACLQPVYMDISRPEYEFPVYRVFIPGLETDTELESGPSPRLLANAADVLIRP